jgi:small subunit ribosomal protein S4e
MAKRGGTHHLKRMAAPKQYKITRKQPTWIQKPLPGRSPSVPLSLVLRQTGVAETAKEAKRMLSSRSVRVDGKVVTEMKRPVGLMDVISAGEGSWVLTFDTKGRLEPKETDRKGEKTCKVEKKFRTSRGVMLTLHDGRAVSYDCKVGDGLRISLKDGKVIERIPLEVGARCFITGGKHVGHEGVVEELIPGDMTRRAVAKCSIDGVSHVVRTESLFPIGGNK